MIAPTWFLLILIITGVIGGLLVILNHLIPQDTFKVIFEKIVFPTFVIGLIYIVLGA